MNFSLAVQPDFPEVIEGALGLATRSSQIDDELKSRLVSQLGIVDTEVG